MKAPEHIPSLPALQAALKRQAFVLALDEERAIAALPKLAADPQLLRKGLETARTVLSARGALTPQQEDRFHRAATLLGLSNSN